jgi:hypothetical protein
MLPCPATSCCMYSETQWLLSQFEQRQSVKLCLLIRQAYCEEALGCSAVFERKDLELTWRAQHACRPNWVATPVRGNRSRTAAQLIRGTCHRTLSDDLNMSRVTQRDNHISTCGGLIDTAGKAGTSSKSKQKTKRCVFCAVRNWSDNLPPTNRHHFQERRTRNGTGQKAMFFDSSGIVHMEFIPEGATVKEILRRLRNSIRLKRPELWRRKSSLLLHDNAPAHHSVLVEEEPAKQQVTVFSHPPHSPDLAPWRLKEKSSVYFSRRCHKGSRTKPVSSYTNISRLAQRPAVSVSREDVNM